MIYRSYGLRNNKFFEIVNILQKYQKINMFMHLHTKKMKEH